MNLTGTHNNTEFSSTSARLTDEELQLTANALTAAATELTGMAFSGQSNFTQDDLNTMMRASALLHEMREARRA